MCRSADQDDVPRARACRESWYVSPPPPLPLGPACARPMTLMRFTRARARADEEDIIDETLYFFKANVLFRNFEVKGPADRILVYLTLYITECLKRIESAPSRAEATRSLTTMALEPFMIPGDPGFPLGTFFPAPANKQEAGMRAHTPSAAPSPVNAPLKARASRPAVAAAQTSSAAT